MVNYKKLLYSLRECSKHSFKEQNPIHEYQRIYNDQLPVKLTGIINDWPAITHPERQWLNLENLKSRTRSKYTVPVEIGGNYMDPNAAIAHTDFANFLDHLDAYTVERDDALRHVYLAQCDLNDMHDLIDDIQTPDICDHTGKGTLYRRNLWFSSRNGAESPCHYDPFQNMLCQVIGSKTILLFPHDQSNNLYPALGTTQKNTSMIDFKDVDMRKYSNASQLSGYWTMLRPGDALFIPKKYWHYCISEELSCSVNFWWL